uniref:RIB43A-like with coiled-coils protein 2 n=1 Tax=Alexandrium andersonii TaxID=327968 RepID=A0A7S2JCW4_9DINO
MVNFIEQQKFERAMISKGAGEEMKAYAKEVADITALRNGMEENESTLRHELQKGQQDANLELAAEKQRQKKLDVLEDHRRNAAELAFHESDPFLNEIGGLRRGTQSGIGEGAGGQGAGAEGEMGHVRGGNFKGSTRAQRVQVAKEQLVQADLDDAKKDVDKLDDHLFSRQQETTRKQMIALEREKARMKRAMAEQVARDNRALHQDQKTNLKRMDQLYTNEFRPEFFEQFGTSTR